MAYVDGMSELTSTALSGAAVVISLLAVIVPALSGRQQRLRDDRAVRSERYLELIALVEEHGLWVVDETYDLLEASQEDVPATMPLRRTPTPSRTARVRARAIVSAYASTSVARHFHAWQLALEEFEAAHDGLFYVVELNGPDAVDPSPLVPKRDREVLTRQHLADAVNGQLVQERRWRRVRPRDLALRSQGDAGGY